MTQLRIPSKLLPIYNPYRYKVLYGGRASAKSISVADFLITKTAYDKRLVLCCREFQSSIKDSVHRLLAERIDALGMSDKYNITRDSIRSKSGSEFIFKGLRQNYQEIKSTQGINYCWVEEAERVSAESWEVLIPTIREEESEILITFNPENEQNPTYQKFVINPPKDSLIIKINYYENPFLPKVLLQEIEHDKLYNPDRFNHIWRGECAKMSNAIIFQRVRIEPVVISELGGIEYFNNKRIDYHYGIDFGFSNDPFAMVETFREGNTIYITKEIYWYGMENMEIVPNIKRIMPHVVRDRRKIYADGSYPATISQLARTQIHPGGERLEALNIEAAIKGKNSVEEGINWLKSYDLIVDPSCKNTIFELQHYKYITDKQTGDIIPEPEDKNNHAMDGLRYAWNGEIISSRGGGVAVYKKPQNKVNRRSWMDG